VSNALEKDNQPSRARMIAAAVGVLLMVLAVWKVIDYRMQPPPPPNPIGPAPANQR